jgi:hypothetical protein
MARDLLCRLVGHKRGQRKGGQYYHHGRWRDRWYTYCQRCGSSDLGEIYRSGIFEALTPWRIRRALQSASDAFRSRRCTDCGKPSIRFGRAVGDHTNCDEIPF